jgi:large subunit ribosomal protein L24
MEKKKSSKAKLHIRKGDTVLIIAGDDRGKTGKVLEVLIEKNRAVVEGINIITKHTKPSAGKPEGGLKKTEAALHVSNLKLVDPATGKPTRIGRKLDTKNKLQRYSKKTGEFIK